MSSHGSGLFVAGDQGKKKEKEKKISHMFHREREKTRTEDLIMLWTVGQI
jgi:hypothetical protein